MESKYSNAAYWLDTASGVRVNFAEPAPEEIQLRDIAVALSNVCRFGGHSRRFYSVAQHALLVQELVRELGRPDLALAALHHDSHEAYICDLPSPLKRYLNARGGLNDYLALIYRFDRVIESALGFAIVSLPIADRRTIDRADRLAFRIEARNLLPNGGKAAVRDNGCEVGRLAQRCPNPISPGAAAEAFLQAHLTLTELSKA
jgi:hypothetical protein